MEEMQQAWENFFHSGKITDYLHAKTLEEDSRQKSGFTQEQHLQGQSNETVF